MKIHQTHFNEWTIHSLVHQEIFKLNVQSINKVEGYSPSSLLHDLLYPNPKRNNSGRLDAAGLRQFDNCLDTSGWWVSGIDPFTWDIMEWGRFKPDPDTPLAQAYFNHKLGKEEKAPKYRSPAGVPSRLVFLRIFDRLWEKISQRYGIPISAEEKQHPGGFWHWVWAHPEIPIILVEGEKKAGCLLSLGYVAIPLPGIWMGRRWDDNVTKINEHLIPDLALFAQEKRPVTIIFDNDVKLKTKINVYKATISTAQLLAKSGCKVQVGTLPSVANGKNAIDDYIVAGGDIGHIISSAVDWKIYKKNLHPCNWKNPVRQNNLTIKGTAISFGKTITELLSGQKTVTRRAWKDNQAYKFIDDWDAKPGEFIYPALTKSYQAGGKQVGYVRLTHRPYLEKLADMPDSDLAAEGFPDLSKQEFIDRFFEGNDQQEVWVIRFELVNQQDQIGAKTKASESERLAEWIHKNAEKLRKWWIEQRKFTPTITQDQKYVNLEEKIPDGTVIGIRSGLGTGKTSLLARLFAEPFIDKKAGIYEEGGQFYFYGAIMLGARNGLLLQNSKRLGFQHLQSEQCFSSLHEKHSKIALCTDSLQHYLDPDWFDGKVLILDEAMETIKHLLTSSTHRKNRAECLKRWEECLKRCKVIICLDGNLADWVIDEYILKFTGYRKVIKLENQYKGDRAPVELLVGTSTNKSKLPENIEKPLKEKGLNSRDISPYIPMILASRCPAIVTDSQKKAETLEYILNLFEKKGIRVDSKTVADKNHPAKTFLAAPDDWIKANLPDFIILSPSAQSGIDINIHDYFSDVFALFFGVVGTDTQMQMPGRIRDPQAHWHIACPEFTRKEGENFSSPVVKDVKEAIENYLLQDAATISINLPQIMQHLEALIKQGLEDNPHHDAWAKLKAKDNYEKANLRECLIEALTGAGHEIKFVELQHNDDGANILKNASEEVLRKEARDIFNAPDIDQDKVQELSAKFDATWEERCQIIKAGYKSRLPGIENSPIWSEELIYLFRKHRDFISQEELYYFLNNPSHLQEQQEELWGYIALGGMKFLADVRSRHLIIKALLKLNIKHFLESEQYWNCNSPEIKQLLTTARRSKKLSAALGITPGKDAIKYLQRVVNLLGHEVNLLGRDSKNTRKYKVMPVQDIDKVALNIAEVKEVLSQCLSFKYNPSPNTQEHSKSQSKWEEAKHIYVSLEKNPENIERPQTEPTPFQPNSVIDIGVDGVVKHPNLDLYLPPPETPLGETAIYQDDMQWTADCLELLIDTPSQQQPDLTPLEVFKYQVQNFGWNVIKEASKHSVALASKVLSLVQQLVEGGEWGIAPG